MCIFVSLRLLVVATLGLTTTILASAAVQGQQQGQQNHRTVAPLTLTKVSQATYPDAKCLDGSPPAFYMRNGTGAGTRSVVIFLEGGGEHAEACRPARACVCADKRAVARLRCLSARIICFVGLCLCLRVCKPPCDVI